MDIQRINYSDSDFWQKLETRLAWDEVSDSQVNQTVEDIIKTVRQKGDAAVVEYTNRFDSMTVSSFSELEISRQRLQQALTKIPDDQRQSLFHTTR